jgi:hypothetical protein
MKAVCIRSKIYPPPPTPKYKPMSFGGKYMDMDRVNRKRSKM